MVTDHALLRNLIETQFPKDTEFYIWQSGLAPDRPPRRNGRTLFYGDPADLETYESLELKDSPNGFIFISFSDRKNESKVAERLHEILPHYPLLTIQQDRPDLKLEETPPVDEEGRVLSLNDAIQKLVAREILHLRNRSKVQRLKSLINPGEKLAILLQHDPDPDGIACALALRVLLGRNRQTTPIFTFGEITRPENQAMCELLEIEILKTTPKDLRAYPRLALVDVQPAVFKRPIPPVHVCIDHHPRTVKDDIPYVDIREDYGATATILCEYLRAEGISLHQRLATALYYGIKTDTLSLNRQVHGNDLESFMTLYPLINYNMLRRIERPEIPLEFLRMLQRSLGQAHFDNGIFYLHLGPLNREDFIPQMADFFNQVKGAEWAFVSGTYKRRFIMSARNNGCVQHAGDLMKSLFDGIGSAGGHRAMAKAVIPLAKFKTALGHNDHAFIQKQIHKLIERALGLTGTSSK